MRATEYSVKCACSARRIIGMTRAKMSRYTAKRGETVPSSKPRRDKKSNRYAAARETSRRRRRRRRMENLPAKANTSVEISRVALYISQYIQNIYGFFFKCARERNIRWKKIFAREQSGLDMKLSASASSICVKQRNNINAS